MAQKVSHQQGRRILPPAQRLAVMDKFKKKIQEQATIKKEESNKEFYGNRFTGKIDSSPNGEQSKTKYHTDKGLAKMASVGTGTIARFNRVINSNKVALEYVRLCGYKQGGDRKSNCQNGTLKLADIAKQLGTSERNLQRALSIERNLTDSMKELLDTGVITKTFAADTIASSFCSKIVTNIRQRGNGNPNPMKLGRCIKELERIYGIKEGRPQKLPNNSVVKSQSDLAKEIGISVDTLQNYKKLTEMIPELEELVDTGIVTKDTALAMMKELSNEEQIEMISSLDTTKRISRTGALQLSALSTILYITCTLYYSFDNGKFMVVWYDMILILIAIIALVISFILNKEYGRDFRSELEKIIQEYKKIKIIEKID